MAVLDLGSITIDDAIVTKVLAAFDQSTPIQLRDVVRLLVRRYLRQELITRYLARIEAQRRTATDAEKATEKAILETGWPEP